jgi:hypothetical protein
MCWRGCVLGSLIIFVVVSIAVLFSRWRWVGRIRGVVFVGGICTMNAKEWYRYYSLVVLVTWGLATAAVMLYGPVNDFRGVFILTNQFYEGWVEFTITILALPGWYMILKEYTLTTKVNA